MYVSGGVDGDTLHETRDAPFTDDTDNGGAGSRSLMFEADVEAT